MHQQGLAAISLNENIVSQLPGPEDLDQRLDEHAQRFSEFARSIISQIFELNPPEKLQKMLITRRKSIIDFLRDHPLENEDAIGASRIYISEILYLRLLKESFYP